MKVFVNGSEIFLDNTLTIFELVCFLNSKADLFIVNSLPRDKTYIIKENDDIFLIKKGEKPKKEHLEYLLTSRQGKNITEILKKSHIAICGCGGLGSHVAIGLARSGVGNIKLIDYDVVEPSNINRQSYFIEQIGEYKTKALKDNIYKINPYISVTTCNTYLNEKNIIKETKDAKVILECFDNVASKIMLIENAITMNDKFIIGASGMAGYSSTDDMKIKTLGKNIIIVGDFQNEVNENTPLMAPRVMACAAIQANETLKYLLKDIK